MQHYYKQFLREKLRAAQAPQWNPTRNFKYKKPGAPANDVILPPLLRHADASLLNPASNLLALAVAQPSLLNDASAEEIWLHAPMPAGWQLQLHQLVTELHIQHPNLDAAMLWQTIIDELPVDSQATSPAR